MKGRFFVVAPCFNEAAGLAGFVEQLCESVTALHRAHDTHLILVDDGSSDDTWRVIEQLTHRPLRIAVHGLRLSRNFGHQSAICAGLELAMNELACEPDDTVAIMDSDGQHPPELLRELLRGRAEGFHHVQMVRDDLESQTGFFKRTTSRLFYKVFSFLSGLTLQPGSSDFRAFSGYFLQQYLRLRESTKFNRGIFSWMGFPTKVVPYAAQPRAAGQSSYSLVRMIRLAAQGIVYFSSRPLVLTSAMVTFGGLLGSFGYVAIETIRVLRGAEFTAGWPTVILSVTIWGTLISLNQFMLSAYVARVFDEVKARPTYLVRDHTRNAERVETSGITSSAGVAYEPGATRQR